MSAEKENFGSLRRVLALKRYETPPPGYHDQAASEIRARLAAGDHLKSDLWREMGEEASWLQRLWGMFSGQPVLASAFGMVVCGLMLTAIYYSQKQDVTQDASSIASQTLPGAGNVGGLNPLTPGLAGSSTSPMLASNGPTLFDQIGNPVQSAPVNFTLPNQ